MLIYISVYFSAIRILYSTCFSCNAHAVSCIPLFTTCSQPIPPCSICSQCLNIIHFRATENGIDYILAGDDYISDLKMSEENRPVGHYGRLYRKYLNRSIRNGTTPLSWQKNYRHTLKTPQSTFQSSKSPPAPSCWRFHTESPALQWWKSYTQSRRPAPLLVSS